MLPGGNARVSTEAQDLTSQLAQLKAAGCAKVFTERKVGFRSLSDAWADTTTAHGRLMLTILGGLAEFERDLIRSRTSEGRERAQAPGVKLGRKPKLTEHQKREAIRRRDGDGEPVREIARSYNVSHSTADGMSDIGYVRDEDKEEYRKFCMHHARGFGRALPAELWHYTDANGLIGILQTGRIWSTQITCLNDSLEQRYFGDLVHATVKTRRAQNTDPILDPLFRVADDALASRDFAPVGQFVACFSEVEDDLGQGRGYGGGECGYAIGFQSQGILDAAQSRPGSLLVPMNYKDNRHNVIVNDVVRMGEIYFRQGLSRGLPDVERWAREFVAAFDYELSVIACVVKHPKFFGEVERRIVTLLQPGEHMALQFRQKRTLLARHLPLDLTSTVDDKRLLPLSRIYVGPGPAQKVSRISVGDLLMQAGYGGVPVEMSKVPYRLP